MTGHDLIKKIQELGPDKNILFWNDDRAYYQNITEIKTSKTPTDEIITID